MMQLEEKYREDLSRQKSEHQRSLADQQRIREELRKELAQMHMDKFSDMAAELSHVHKVQGEPTHCCSVIHQTQAANLNAPRKCHKRESNLMFSHFYFRLNCLLRKKP